MWPFAVLSRGQRGIRRMTAAQCYAFFRVVTARSTALSVTRLHRGGAEGASFACRSGNTFHFIFGCVIHAGETGQVRFIGSARVYLPTRRCPGRPANLIPWSSTPRSRAVVATTRWGKLRPTNLGARAAAAEGARRDGGAEAVPQQVPQARPGARARPGGAAQGARRSSVRRLRPLVAALGALE